MIQRERDHIGILQRKLLVVQQSIDCAGFLCGRAAVNGVEHPKRFCPARVDERLRGSHVSRIIAHEQPHQKLGVNSAHVSGEYAF